MVKETGGVGVGQVGARTDVTSKTDVTVNIVNTLPNVSCTPACFGIMNLKVKVGTKITWVNKSTTPHTVTAIKGLIPTSEVADPTVFDSGITTAIAPHGTYTYTVTMAAYNAN